jgi:hypothetical protein
MPFLFYTIPGIVILSPDEYREEESLRSYRFTQVLFSKEEF